MATKMKEETTPAAAKPNLVRSVANTKPRKKNSSNRGPSPEAKRNSIGTRSPPARGGGVVGEGGHDRIGPPASRGGPGHDASRETYREPVDEDGVRGSK